MPTVRVKKINDFVVINNQHLNNRNLSLEAKGLMTQMLSLPEDWDFSLEGLANINRDKVDVISEAICELEKEGYIERKICDGVEVIQVIEP